jgi:hypothetical protein
MEHKLADATALTGGSSSYYRLLIVKPTSGAEAYWTECNDIIEALQLNYKEGNALKAIWRIGASRLGTGKPGTTALYDAEKVVFFGERMVVEHTKL